MWSVVLAIFVTFGTVCGEWEPKVIPDPSVKTEFGSHKGIWTESMRGNQVASFLGIPYAKPPTGDRRFQNPEPLNKLRRRARDDTKYASPCMTDFGDKEGSEDCLYLNIFTGHPENDTGRAVIVFLISTSNKFGGNDNSLYDSYYLLDQDVVLVTVNYRLGFFGFFTTGDETAPGNYGLKDVLEALRWVQSNIAFFGGDPNAVTLAGHGVGAGVVHLLTLSDKSEGLFHRYITQSGTALSPWSYRPRRVAENTSKMFAVSMNCNFTTSEEIVKCLRDIPADTSIHTPLVGTQNSWVAFGPTDEPESEDAVITKDPKTLMLTGNIRDIPWLAGVTADEGLLQTLNYTKNTTYCDGLEKYFEYFIFSLTNHREIVVDPSIYIKDLADYYFSDNFTDCSDLLTELVGDMLVNWPVYQTVEIQVDRTESDLYFYNFAYNGTFSTTFEHDPSRYGISHGDDLNYLFPVLNNYFDGLQLRNTVYDTTMINIVTEMWESFAKNGIPKARLSGDWDPYNKAHEYLEFNHEAEISMEKDFLVDRMTFWSNFTDKHFPTAENYVTCGVGSVSSVEPNIHIFKNVIIPLVHLTIPAILVH